MGGPVFSVIIPVYNVAQYVSATVRSVLDQDYDNFEVVIVNDGSTDGSLSIVRGFTDNRIRIIDKPNTGVSDSRNIACHAAKGDYLAFLDADDYWYPDHLSEAVAFFSEFPDIPWYGAAQFHVKYGSALSPRKSGRRFSKRLFWEDGKNWIDSTNLIIKKELFDESGGYPIDMTQFEDNYFQSLIGLNHPVVGTNSRVTSVYFRRPNSASSHNRGDMSFVFEKLVELHARAIRKFSVANPIYPRRMVQNLLKASLFRRSKADVLALCDRYGFILFNKQIRRWRLFISFAYGLAGAGGLDEELKYLVTTPIKARFVRTVKIYREYGFVNSVRWIGIVLLYSWRGWRDSREK